MERRLLHDYFLRRKNVSFNAEVVPTIKKGDAEVGGKIR